MAFFLVFIFMEVPFSLGGGDDDDDDVLLLLLTPPPLLPLLLLVRLMFGAIFAVL